MAAESKASTATIVRLLGDWRATGTKLSRNLEHALRDLIELGELRPGSQLPSERTLADALAVSRTTVTAAYEALAEATLVHRHVGSGTKVAGATLTEVNPHGEDRVLRYMDAPLGTVDFVNAAVAGLPLVAEVAGAVSTQDYRDLMERQAYSPLGLWDLRVRIAERLTALGAPTTPDQILVTSGAQQALELVTSALLKPGDLVLAEDPTFRAALQRLRDCGARVEGVPSDEHGVDVRAFEYAVARFPVRLAYLLPAIHNPTGAALSQHRAERIAALAAETKTFVVDDRSLADTTFAGSAAMPLAARHDSEWILTLGSFSKTFWSGLRVGWVRASVPLIRGLAEIKATHDLGTSLVSQAIVLRLLDHWEEAVSERRSNLHAGYQRLTSLLREWLPDWSWQVPQGGSSLWVRLPSPCSIAFSSLAQRHGVAVLPGPIFSPSDGQGEFLRVPFIGRPPILETGVERLAKAWSQMSDYRAPDYPAHAAD